MSAARESQPDQITDAVWRTRRDLAAFYRIVHFPGGTDLIRIPDPPDCFAINRYERRGADYRH